MSERQATLHDERIDLLSAMVIDLRARLATAEAERNALMEGLGLDPSPECRDEYPPERLKAEGYGVRMLVEALEAERDALKKALKKIDRHVIGAYETAAGSVEPCDECGEMREIAAQGLARAAAQDGKP